MAERLFCNQEVGRFEPDIRLRMSNMNPKDRDRRIRALTLRDGGSCHYCKVVLDASTTTVDHVIPRARGGCNAIVNLVLACEPCNHARADMSYTKFCQRMREAMLEPGPLVRPLGGPARIKQKKKIYRAKLRFQPFEDLDNRLQAVGQ